MNICLESSSGTYKTNTDHLCFLPKEPWQFIESKDSTNNKVTIISGIATLVLPEDMYDLFHAKIYPVIVHGTQEARQNALKNYKNAILNKIQDIGILKVITEYSFELCFNPPNCPSTAYNHKNDQMIGLHIYTHEVKSISDRINGFQLVCFNLGKTERYFHFINLPVTELIEAVNKKKHTGSNYSSIRELKNDFLSLYPDHPVKRITLQPRHGYIAITQNMIHDGATNLKDEMDIALLIGGKFEWQPP